jgi:rsbT co-antagonist protein RsbR
VILDLTGIDLVDSMVATHLLKLGGAIRLMGAECLLTGMGARIAQTFVALGISLEGILPVATLKEGLKYCLSQSPQRTSSPGGAASPRRWIRPG